MINYQFIADAHRHYGDLGYARLDAPWWTSLEINHITKPEVIRHIPDFHLPLNNQVLVASAEQSFLAMAEKGQMPVGRFFATTPCFRNEPDSKLSCQYFIKTELIDTRDVNETSLSLMIEDAYFFFNNVVPNPGKLEIVKTPEGYDIEYGGIEVGSYGLRSCPFLNWVFGTGCAEPRLSRAIRYTS